VATRQNLPILRFHGKRLGYLDWLIVIIPVSLGILALVGIGISNARTALMDHGPAAALESSSIWFLATTILLLLLSVYLSFRIFSAHKYVIINRRGIKIRQSALEKLDFRWSQISGIAYGNVETNLFGIRLAKQTSVTLFPTIGKPLRIGSEIQNLTGLTLSIKKHLYPLVMPNLRADFDEGKWVFFGPIRINQTSLAFDGRLFDWREIRSIDIISGFLVIGLHNRSRIQAKVTNVPNLELLLHLVDWGINRRDIGKDASISGIHA
jgi:hypothetical protein